LKRKVILSCAVTGDGPLNPKFQNYPITPEQIAKDSLEAASAGASIVHLHARDPKTGLGSRDVHLFSEIKSRIREKNADIVLNLSAGMGGTYVPDENNEGTGGAGTDMASATERLAHVRRDLPQICTLDVTTLNLEGGIGGAEACVYMNTTRTLKSMAAQIKALGVRPEIEAFNPGDLLFARQLLDQGLIERPAMFQLCLGVRWSAPADMNSLLYMKSLVPEGANWSAFGVSRHQMEVVAMSTILGGNCRVGLEDNIYMERGVFATNAKLVERAVTIITALGCDIATPAEARAILQLDQR
jgi:uncharacterized protein (DUF849 family)